MRTELLFPQTTIFEVKGEPKQIRTEVAMLTSHSNALPLGQTGSLRVCSDDELMLNVLRCHETY